MTIQELLLQDSSVIIPVGANKLQTIIKTLKGYVKLTEDLSEALNDINDDIQMYREKISELEEVIESQKSEIKELKETKVRCTVDLDLSDLLKID